MHRTDQALIDAVVREDSHSAFTELVKRYQSPLRYSLRQLTGWNEALADDLAQETFIRAYAGLAGYQGKAKFSSWLYRIAYNQMVNHFRVARNRELTGAIDAQGSVSGLSDQAVNGAFNQAFSRQLNQEPNDENRDHRDTVEQQSDQQTYQQSHQLHRDLANAMAQLSDNQRMALHLHLHRECTQQEISDIMSIPLGTVKTLITRGRSRLRELLSDWQTSDHKTQVGLEIKSASEKQTKDASGKEIKIENEATQ